MSEFEVPFQVKVLPYGSTHPVFRDETMMLDPMKDNVSNLKDRLGVRALVIHGAQVLDDADTVRNWYSPSFPIIVVECSRSFEESDEWAKNSNCMARLLNAQVTVRNALVCLSRAHWQEGYAQFLEAASSLRRLVDKTGLSDFQRRTELICVSMTLKELNPVAPFIDRTRELLPPPSLRGDNSGGPFVGEWVEHPRPTISAEEAAILRSKSIHLRQIQDTLKDATKALVRIFGYHPLSPSTAPLQEDARQRVVAATGFFISPIHILTTRTVKFFAQSDTYAQRFSFTRNVRAVHGMLRKDIDLHECREVPKQVRAIADVINSIGVEMSQKKFPAGLQSAPWCDLMLLEVVNARDAVQDHEYLLPDLACAAMGKGEEVLALHYPSRPTEEYFSDVFGGKGHNTAKITSDDVGTQFWDYNQLCCSFGSVQQDLDASKEIRHTCSLLQGSRGCPIIAASHVAPEGSKKRQTSDISCTFAGIQVGRAVEQLETERSNIISMSTSDVARQEGLGVNMYNEAVAADHIVLMLLYLKFVAGAITNTDHQKHLHAFLAQYRVLVSPEILSQCHRRMLKDADDYNEYGMDFYEHQDLTSALECFREGAKMFTTASIPNLSKEEQDLKNALQTNVSAVVVAKMNSEQR